MTAADLALVTDWRGRPHVRRWWGDPQVEPEREKLRDPRLALWVVALEGRPFGFIQDYRVHDHLPHHFEDLPPGSRGLDLFIGEDDLIGRGHGAGLLRQHVDAMFTRGVPAAGIDPHPDNDKARRAFARAGFRETGGPRDTRWGRAVLMRRDAGA